MVEYVSYLRVSTRGQSVSGLGIAAQQTAIDTYVKNNDGNVLESFIEVESGKKADRPELLKALSLAKRKKAVLLISKLDRLSRSVSFISALMESKVQFIALDMPQANALTIHIMSAVAQQEREAISARTSAALQAKIRQGAKLGLSNPCRVDALSVSRKGTSAVKTAADAFAAKMKPVIAGLRASGVDSYVQLAKTLNENGFKTARGGSWFPTTIRNLCLRFGV